MPLSEKMEELNSTLSAAARRQVELDRLIAEAEEKLKQRKSSRKASRGGRGRGRLNGSEQATDNKLNASLVRLRAGVLPGEQMNRRRWQTIVAFRR